MRGTLTNGYEWLFVVLTVNLTGGASYVVSIREHSVAPQDVGGKMVLNENQADMIAGILASLAYSLPGYVAGYSECVLVSYSTRSYTGIAAKTLERIMVHCGTIEIQDAYYAPFQIMHPSLLSVPHP
jgi:hypothetical protein